jgi:hypothetical protein
MDGYTMTTRISSDAQDRKTRMARALVLLITVLGTGLVGASWLLQSNTSIPVTQLAATSTLADIPNDPITTALPTKPSVADIPVDPITTILLEKPPAPTTTPPKPITRTPAATPSEKVPTPTPTPPSKTTSSTGWIYAGQFMEGEWIERGLVIGNALPSSGQSYALNWGANIRSQPPGKDTELSENIGYLAQGHSVEIVQVRKSGTKGHVWLEIKR